MQIRKDFIGIPLEIGDYVAYSSSPSTISRAIVIGFTPKKIKIRTPGKYVDDKLKYPGQLISLKGSYDNHPELLL